MVAFRTVFGLMLLAVALATVGDLFSSPVRAESIVGFSDDELMDGFQKTVFGVEYGSAVAGGSVKKFDGAVRIRVVNLADKDRQREIAGFVSRLPRLVRGLDIRMAAPGENPNFTVYVVDRADYVDTVRADVLGSTHGAAPGQCLVRVYPSSLGIVRSTAVIVSDEGDSLFRRCMVEEILQGLGPMNDNAALYASVFNDRSRHDRFMPFDRAVVSMLYDRRIRPGMTRTEVGTLLPAVLADVRRSVR
ncbi:conserved exported hypothetical protein [uncultured Pleomorphomonas sp.]|uniref:DUF2927 domain-containing protein n=2 Tax=Pleomorphomonas TaxID=261933 RepID=A0A2G9WS88_9HYPH|nr:DUF2927 domain-containing protein [Pleomorphomonas carboxyditropha]PIO97515.1 hypothetical protein CJ014_19925 [Pleomorphomonas carboxyditropha]SCM78721.1 conserved exported hypothetical protein [uncultured Pleomorphomonas sp.]